MTDADHVHVFNPSTGERLQSSAEVPADAVIVSGLTVDEQREVTRANAQVSTGSEPAQS